MLKTRLIPVLLLKDGNLIRSENFSIHKYIGDPVHEVIRLSEWCVDELVYINIPSARGFSLGRNDSKITSTQSELELIRLIGKHCFMPLAFGGGIRSLDDIRLILENGADKVVLNTILHKNPNDVKEAIRLYGSQAVVACIDARRGDDGHGYYPYIESGTQELNYTVEEWASKLEDLGVGEILIQSIDRDGSGLGYDHQLINSVVRSVDIPVIALGGAGEYDDFVKVVVETGVSAVAAANIFHFREMSERFIKRAMARANIAIRNL